MAKSKFQREKERDEARFESLRGKGESVLTAGKRPGTAVVKTLPRTGISEIPPVTRPGITENALITGTAGKNPLIPGEITQEQLDEAREAGIDVFSPRALKAMAKTDIRARERFNEINPLVQQIGQPVPSGIAPIERGEGQLLGEVAPEIAAEFAQDVALGAGAGAAFGGGVGAIPGAIIGGGVAAVKSINIISQMKEEERQNVKVQYKTYRESSNNLKAIINHVNSGLLDPAEGMHFYNKELAKIDAAEKNLKTLGENEWLSKTQDELTTIQTFNDIERPIYQQLLTAALFSPNPAKQLQIEDILNEK